MIPLRISQWPIIVLQYLNDEIAPPGSFVRSYWKLLIVVLFVMIVSLASMIWSWKAARRLLQRGRLLPYILTAMLSLVSLSFGQETVLSYGSRRYMLIYFWATLVFASETAVALRVAIGHSTKLVIAERAGFMGSIAGVLGGIDLCIRGFDNHDFLFWMFLLSGIITICVSLEGMGRILDVPLLLKFARLPAKMILLVSSLFFLYIITPIFTWIARHWRLLAGLILIIISGMGVYSGYATKYLSLFLGFGFLGGIELIGKDLHIPYMRQALRGPVLISLDFITDHYLLVIGFVALVCAAYAVHVRIWFLAVIFLPTGVELIARDLEIPYLDRSITYPIERTAVVVRFLAHYWRSTIAVFCVGISLWLGWHGYHHLFTPLICGAIELVSRDFTLGFYPVTLVWFNIVKPFSIFVWRRRVTWIGLIIIAFSAYYASIWIVVPLLGGVELVGRDLAIPVAQHALTGPIRLMYKCLVWFWRNVVVESARWCKRHYRLIFGLCVLTVVMLVRTWLAIPIALGGFELIGRDLDIRYMRRALSGPVFATWLAIKWTYRNWVVPSYNTVLVPSYRQLKRHWLGIVGIAAVVTSMWFIPLLFIGIECIGRDLGLPYARSLVSGPVHKAWQLITKLAKAVASSSRRVWMRVRDPFYKAVRVVWTWIVRPVLMHGWKFVSVVICGQMTGLFFKSAIVEYRTGSTLHVISFLLAGYSALMLTITILGFALVSDGLMTIGFGLMRNADLFVLRVVERILGIIALFGGRLAVLVARIGRRFHQFIKFLTDLVTSVIRFVWRWTVVLVARFVWRVLVVIWTHAILGVITSISILALLYASHIGVIGGAGLMTYIVMPNISFEPIVQWLMWTWSITADALQITYTYIVNVTTTFMQSSTVHVGALRAVMADPSATIQSLCQSRVFAWVFYALTVTTTRRGFASRKAFTVSILIFGLGIHIWRHLTVYLSLIAAVYLIAGWIFVSFERRAINQHVPRATNQEEEAVKIHTIIYHTDGWDAHNADCAICIDQFEEGDTTVVLRCRHAFHSDCMKEWYEKQRERTTCPLCRASPLGDSTTVNTLVFVFG